MRGNHGDSIVRSATQDWKRFRDLLRVLGLYESLDQLVMANTVFVGSCVEDGRCSFIRLALNFKVEGQRGECKT